MFFFKKKDKHRETIQDKSPQNNENLEENENLTIAPSFSDEIDNYVVNTAPGSNIKISKIHSVGRRANQQDSFAYSDVENIDEINKKGILILVADGMGGLSNGAEVSSLVAVEMLRQFDQLEVIENVPATLIEMVQNANEKVNDFLGEDGIGKSGTTLVAAILKDHMVYWVSVGDSFIYHYHDNQLHRLNKLHNYGEELDEMVENGEILPEEANAHPSRAALTSYIGAGTISKLDYNEQPLFLEPDDRLLLMSDGIATISEEELAVLLHYEIEEAALKIRYEIEEKGRKKQDNYTAIIVQNN